MAGPEAANNAAFVGVLVPLLTIGIPTSATAAILIAAFQIFDLQPGPQLFANEPDLVWALIASLYVGNVMLLRRTLLVSDGDFGAFLDRPFAMALFALALAALILPSTVGAVRRVRGLGDAD